MEDSLIGKLRQSAIDTLAQLDGTYALALYDRDAGSLMLTADRFGFMPLYYCERGDSIVFASEVKAILRVLDTYELDWDAAADFFYVGHMLGNRTLFREIYALEPGEVITHRGGKSRHERYHDFTQLRALSPEHVSSERVASLFASAVRRRAKSDMPHTILLSGGLDSRLVLGALRAAGIDPRPISLEHADELGGTDGKLGCQLAESLGLTSELRPTRSHFISSGDWLKTYYILDGMVPNLELFISQVHAELDPSLGLVWDGLALDVALGGAHQAHGTIDANLKHFIGSRSAYRLLLKIILSAQYFRKLDRTFLSRLWAEVAKIPSSENQFLLFLLMNRTRRRIAVNPYQLYSTRADPMTPAEDTDFMEYVLGIPSQLKLSRSLYFEVLRRNFPELTNVPAISGGEMVSFATTQQTRSAGAILARLTDLGTRAARAVRRFAGTARRIRRRLSPESEAAQLVIRILKIRKFDRPFYHRRSLRFLFAFYRHGLGILHPLFKTACYLELWHMMFLDADAPVLFNTDGVGLECDKEAQALAGRPAGGHAR